MWLVVGLGNPGKTYARQRHNVGFMLADAILHRQHFASWRKKFQGEFTAGDVADQRVLLLKPQTFMNESGRSVREAARFHDVELSKIVVIHDELDLAAGKLRVKIGGGVAGHNGLRSIASHLGSREFKRIRIGIGHPGHKDRVTRHVLGDFAKADKAWLDPLIDTAADEIALIVEEQDGSFMNKIALTLNPPPPKPEKSSDGV